MVSAPLIVIPAFNEAGTVAQVVRDVHAHVPSATVLVVDDGSADDTAGVARRAGALVVRHPFNLGVGAAIRSGMHFAALRGHDAVVQVDADGQHPAAAIPELLGSLDRADLVIGSRFTHGDRYSTSRLRRLGMQLLRSFVARRTGHRLPDVTSGFRAHGPAALEVLSETYPAEYLSDTIESLVISADANLRIVAVSVSMASRQGGTASHGPLRSAAYLGRVLILLIALSGRRPRASR